LDLWSVRRFEYFYWSPVKSCRCTNLRGFRWDTRGGLNSFWHSTGTYEQSLCALYSTHARWSRPFTTKTDRSTLKSLMECDLTCEKHTFEQLFARSEFHKKLFGEVNREFDLRAVKTTRSQT
jgi:hypothetical protein